MVGAGVQLPGYNYNAYRQPSYQGYGYGYRQPYYGQSYYNCR